MKVILDVHKLENAENAHEYLKGALNFPEYYGKNLDALYDCLILCSATARMQENILKKYCAYSKRHAKKIKVYRFPVKIYGNKSEFCTYTCLKEVQRDEKRRDYAFIFRPGPPRSGEAGAGFRKGT